jgi:non-specific protein-tyrosine kinase
MSAFSDERPDTVRYFDALRHHWILITTLVITAVAAAAFYSITAPKRYEAKVDVLVTPVRADDETFVGINVLRDSGDPTRSVVTAARLAKTPEIGDGVRERLGGFGGRNPLRAVDVKPVGQANIISIVAHAGTADGAATIANAFADELIEQRTAGFQAELQSAMTRLRERLRAAQRIRATSVEALVLQERLADLNSLVGASDPTLRIVSRADPPTSPVSPRPKLSLAVALVTALLLGIGAAVAFEFVDPRVKSEDELLLQQRLPVLARVPRLRRNEARAYLGGWTEVPSDFWEAYRALRVNLARGAADHGMPRTIIVTSAIPGEGKTMTAMNLAISLATSGMRVILVDGDLRRPILATVFGIPLSRSGFSDVFLRGMMDEGALTRGPVQEDYLRLLLAAPERAQYVDMLDSARVERALNWLTDRADVVVIDSPALTEVADALTLADAVDAVLIAVRLGYTRRDKLQELRRMFARRGITPLGFVVTTKEPPRRHGYYGSPEAIELQPPGEADARVTPVRRDIERRAGQNP